MYTNLNGLLISYMQSKSFVKTKFLDTFSILIGSGRFRMCWNANYANMYNYPHYYLTVMIGTDFCCNVISNKMLC